MRIRLGVVFGVLLLLPAWRVPSAHASAEIHRLNVAVSAIPTQVRAESFNRFVDDYNRTQVIPRGLEPLGSIKLSWLLDGEVRYFARQNLAVTLGAGRLSTKKSQEYLPAIGQSVIFSASISSVPIHAGAAYYFRPYNQGDFQARAYAGGGFTSLVHTRGTRQVVESGIFTGVAGRVTGTNDGPGCYGEFGAHLFFASRYSILLSALYRSNVVRNLVNEDTGTPLTDLHGQPVSLDVGGVGFRMALGIGL